MNLDELERSLLTRAREELTPGALDRERHHVELLARLDGAAPWQGIPSAPAPARAWRAATGKDLAVNASLSWARWKLLAVGLVIGAAIGGWVGFGLGRRASTVAVESTPAAAVELATGGSGAGPTPSLAELPDGAAEGATDSASLAPSARAGTSVGSTHGAASALEARPRDGELAARGVSTVRSAPKGAAERGAARGVGTPAHADAPSGASAAPAALDGAAHGAPRGASRGAAAAEAGSTEPGKAGSSLAVEVWMLQRARRALNAQNGELALGIVEELDQRFPRGVLMEERNATRILSLCALGRDADARRFTAAFLGEHPGSVYAARVRDSCGASGAR